MLIKQLDCLTVSALGTELAFLEHDRYPGYRHSPAMAAYVAELRERHGSPQREVVSSFTLDVLLRMIDNQRQA